MGGRAPEPAIGSRVLPQRWVTVRRLQEHLLGQIFGIVGAASYPVEDSIHPGEVAAKECLERWLHVLLRCWAFDCHHVALLLGVPSPIKHRTSLPCDTPRDARPPLSSIYWLLAVQRVYPLTRYLGPSRAMHFPRWPRFARIIPVAASSLPEPHLNN